MSFGKFVRREGDDLAEELRALLPGKGFGRAIDILEMIASKTEDKQMYDQREKALRDYEFRCILYRSNATSCNHACGTDKARRDLVARSHWVGPVALGAYSFSTWNVVIDLTIE